MANTKKQKGILLLDREKVDCFIPSHPEVLSLPFPPTAIKNMDVVEKSVLASVIHAFLETNKLPPTSFTLLLHERVLFEKLFPLPLKKNNEIVAKPELAGGMKPTISSIPPQSTTVMPQKTSPNLIKSASDIAIKTSPAAPEGNAIEDEEKAIQQFIDSVPFDETMVKRIKSPEGTRVIVANKTTVVALKEIFIQEEFEIESILPWNALPKEINLANGMSVEIGTALLAKVDAARPQSFLMTDGTSPAQAGPVSLGMPKGESDKKRLYLMISVFGILVLVMIILFIRMNAENAALTKKPDTTVGVATPTVPVIIVEPTTVIVASTSAEEKRPLPIEITSNRDRASLSAALVIELKDNGYENISQRSFGATNAQARIIFPPTIPVDVQVELTDLVRGFDEDVLVQTADPSETSITISF